MVDPDRRRQETAQAELKLQHLSGLTRLQKLSLFAGSNITDAGLAHLKTLAALKSLELGQTRVTDQGLAVLQKRLPNCVIQK